MENKKYYPELDDGSLDDKMKDKRLEDIRRKEKILSSPTKSTSYSSPLDDDIMRVKGSDVTKDATLDGKRVSDSSGINQKGNKDAQKVPNDAEDYKKNVQKGLQENRAKKLAQSVVLGDSKYSEKFKADLMNQMKELKDSGDVKGMQKLSEDYKNFKAGKDSSLAMEWAKKNTPTSSFSKITSRLGKAVSPLSVGARSYDMVQQGESIPTAIAKSTASELGENALGSALGAAGKVARVGALPLSLALTPSSLGDSDIDPASIDENQQVEQMIQTYDDQVDRGLITPEEAQIAKSNAFNKLKSKLM